MTTIRAIAPIGIGGLKPMSPKTPMPEFQVVDPRSLFVDGAYQRSIGERGRRQIRKIIENFCWTRFKPPICAFGMNEGERVLMVLDGQHTAIAAASNPHIHEIPVMIVDAPRTAEQAAAFVGQNTERVVVTPLQLFQASIIAEDEDALTVEQVCQRAGVKVLSMPPSHAKYNARDTVAVTTLRGLIVRQTAMGARRILEVLANAELAPITMHHIRAAEFLMTNKDHAQKFDPEDLSKAISDLFLVAEDEAKVLAHAHRMPYFRALAAVWFRKTKKRRAIMRVVA